MKFQLILLLVAVSYSFSFGQGMISDIMQVETVSMNLSEVNEKMVSKYQTTLEKETASMDKDLAKIDEKYQKEVAKIIEDFSETLEDGEEQIVRNTKNSAVTKVNSLTMTHRLDKKNRVQSFVNKMQAANHRLPIFMRKNAAVNVDESATVHFAIIESDYRAHLSTIDIFEAQEHLIVTETATVSVQ